MGRLRRGRGGPQSSGKAEDRPREGWGLVPKCAPTAQGRLGGPLPGTRGDRPRDARLPAPAAQHQADPVPADDQAGLGPPSRPGQLGSGRAPPAGICMTKRGAGGSGRPPTSPRPQLPAKPPPRARRPPGAGARRAGAGRHASPALSCVCSGGAARGGTKASRPDPAGGVGEGTPAGPSRRGPRPSTAVYTLAPHPRVHGGTLEVMSQWAPAAAPKPGTSSLRLSIQGLDQAQASFCPLPGPGDLHHPPSPTAAGQVRPLTLPGPPSWAPTCSPSSSQEAPSDPSPVPSCTPSPSSPDSGEKLKPPQPPKGSSPSSAPDPPTSAWLFLEQPGPRAFARPWPCLGHCA